MRIIVFTILASFLVISCKEKKRNDFFPVLSFIQSQVKHVDTSVYGITRIITIDSLADTTAIPREDFRKEAEDFLNIPDLTEGKFTGKYEEKKDFDQDLNLATFSYLPLKKGLQILREEVNITPTEAGYDKINSIYIEKMKEGKDSTIIKKLLWEADQSFKIVTIVQKVNIPDNIIQKEVTWNKQDEDQK